MRRLVALMTVLALWVGQTGLGAAYGQTIEVSSRSQLVDAIVERLMQRTESFRIHYAGARDLSNVNLLDDFAAYDGSELSSLLSSVYGVGYVELRSSYITGNDISYTVTADYENTAAQMQRLDQTLDGWLAANVSTEMPEAVRVAVVSKHLSQRLQYLLDQERNNAYDGYFDTRTACSGYAELTWHLLRKLKIPVKMISGHIPEDLTDTEYLSRRITPSQMVALSNQDTEAQMRSLHVWNLVQLGGVWYHLDNTWLDGDRDGEGEDGALHPEFFLGGDSDFGRNHLWVREGYPTAPGSWWDGSQGALKDFLQVYLKAPQYGYPEITSQGDLNRFIGEAYGTGRAEQTFRITQGVQPYDSFPSGTNARQLVQRTRSDYRVAPVYDGDRYLLTVEFKGRSPVTELLPELQASARTERGSVFSAVSLLKHPERSDHSAVRWISLTPGLLTVEGENFIAKREGRGYIGAFTRDEAVIIPLDISAPQLQVLLNGEPLALTPGPVILNGRTLVPLRGLFEAMGADVYYDDATRTITAFRGGRSLQLTLDSRTAIVNGAAQLLDVPPQIVGSRAFVPARLVAESLGAEVQWDGDRNRVLIEDAGGGL